MVDECVVEAVGVQPHLKRGRRGVIFAGMAYEQDRHVPLTTPYTAGPKLDGLSKARVALFELEWLREMGDTDCPRELRRQRKRKDPGGDCHDPPRPTSGPGSTLPMLCCTECLLRNDVKG